MCETYKCKRCGSHVKYKYVVQIREDSEEMRKSKGLGAKQTYGYLVKRVDKNGDSLGGGCGYSEWYGAKYAAERFLENEWLKEHEDYEVVD